jgi:hypothetical protein
MVLYARGDEVELTGNERFIFPMMRQHIDRAAEAYNEVVERNRANGMKGGRPPKNPVGFSETQSNPENPVGFSETQKSQEEEKEEEKEEYIECVMRDAKRARTRTRFTAPEETDVVQFMQQYAAQKGLAVNAQDQAERFCDHYAANGWKVSGKSPMKDWKASARSWLRNDFTQKQPQRQTQTAQLMRFGEDNMYDR